MAPGRNPNAVRVKQELDPWIRRRAIEFLGKVEKPEPDARPWLTATQGHQGQERSAVNGLVGVPGFGGGTDAVEPAQATGAADIAAAGADRRRARRDDVNPDVAAQRVVMAEEKPFGAPVGQRAKDIVDAAF